MGRSRIHAVRLGGVRGAVSVPLLLWLGFGAALGVLAAGARVSAQERPASDGGAYRRPLANDPVTLDPARIGDVFSRSVAQQIFDGLVQFDQTLTIMPALAQFWKASRDGLTWTFTLRKGVRFHHGRVVTADDVVFSLTRLLDPAVKSGAADLFLGIRGAPEFRDRKATHVAGLAALDPHTVQVTLTEAPVPFVSLLGLGHAKIVPRDAVTELGEQFGTRPVGTGPFRFVRWERGREIVLAANPDYFDGPPKLGRVVFRVFPGGPRDAIYQEFKSGGLEDTLVPAKDYRQVIASPQHQYVRRPMFSLRHYGLNTRQKPLDDRRVRQALNYAIDRDAIVEEIFLSRFLPARGILPPGTLGYNPQLRGYPHDPARARELLAQAGYPGGQGPPPLAIWSATRDEDVLKEHERIRQDLAAVGIRAEFQYLPDWPAYTKRLGERGFPVYLYAWFADVPDPENFLGKLFHSRSARNYTGYANPAVDRLLEDARREDNPVRRVELYRRAEVIVLDDAPIIPFWYHTYERLFQPYVRGVEVSGLGDPYIPLRKIWLDRPRGTP
jgi:oligopeptide transport system substrate-binding protein